MGSWFAEQKKLSTFVQIGKIKAQYLFFSS